jgi:hypothetical protein
MRVQVDKARGNDKVVGEDHLFGRSWWAAADLRDFAVFNPDVGLIAWDTGPIHNGPPTYLQVEFSHAEASFA